MYDGVLEIQFSVAAKHLMDLNNNKNKSSKFNISKLMFFVLFDDSFTIKRIFVVVSNKSLFQYGGLLPLNKALYLFFFFS
jgi:hypothetical protein